MTDKEIQKSLENQLEKAIDYINSQDRMIAELQVKNHFQQAEIKKYEQTVGKLLIKDGEVIGLLDGKETKYIKKGVADTLKRVAVKSAKVEAINDFAERFLKIVHDNHYLLVDRINSKDYGMFTIGIEQAVDETKKEMVGGSE